LLTATNTNFTISAAAALHGQYVASCTAG
jgi:hypothetical protein